MYLLASPWSPPQRPPWILPDEGIKNGTVSFNVTTEGPVTPIPGAPDCPNLRWTEDITDVAFTSATVTVEQGGVAVLEETYAL